MALHRKRKIDIKLSSSHKISRINNLIEYKTEYESKGEYERRISDRI